jgi:hypothetical protein
MVIKSKKHNNIMDNKTQQLLDKVLHAHGIESATQFKQLHIHTSIGGAIWGMKGHEGALEDVIFEGSLTEQKSQWTNIFQKGTPQLLNLKMFSFSIEAAAC